MSFKFLMNDINYEISLLFGFFFVCLFVIHSFKLSGLLFIALLLLFLFCLKYIYIYLPISICILIYKNNNSKQKKMSEDILLYINIINFAIYACYYYCFNFHIKYYIIFASKQTNNKVKR